MNIPIGNSKAGYIGGRLDGPDGLVMDLNQFPILVEGTKPDSDSKQEELKKEFSRFISLATKQLA